MTGPHRNWARGWALGPWGRRGGWRYGAGVGSDDGDPGGERHEQLDQERGVAHARPCHPGRPGADGGGVSRHHRGGGGDCVGDHGYGHRAVDLRRDHRADRRSDWRLTRLARLRSHDDAGQAFPIYITVVGGLLFLALAYLAVGQAAANRSGAQTAADAAALAAAQETRDDLAGAWLDDVLDPTKWQEIFDGNAEGVLSACWRAHELAAMNDAEATCAPDGLLAYEVTATTTDTVGDSIVPGTEDMTSEENARAVIEPRCTFDLPGEDAGDDVLPSLSCGGEDWELDPENLIDLPGPEDLFDVHLAD